MKLFALFNHTIFIRKIYFIITIIANKYLLLTKTTIKFYSIIQYIFFMLHNFSMYTL